MAFAAGLLFVGIYCLLTMKNVIKLFIGIEVISKGVSLALLATGFVKKNILLAQSLVITFIVVEVCLVATALALIINIYRHTNSLDIRKLTKLKG
jgi:multisubunit Na+/H+ antiporter MnhC subunit